MPPPQHHPTSHITGIDHVVLAVSDLEAASKALADALGLVVQPGGAHPGWGTHNAIVRFGTSYLELIAVHDAVEAAAMPRGQRVLDRIRAHSSGWLGYALASDDLPQTVATLRAAGLSASDPHPGRRVRPDGVELRWHTSALDREEAMWGGTLPFLIQHETPAAVRASWAPSGHPIGPVTLKGVGIAVHDLEAAVALYAPLFGHADPRPDTYPFIAARRASWWLPDGFIVRLMAPEVPGRGPVADHLAHYGESLYVVGLGVPSVSHATAVLRARGTTVSPPQPGPAAFLTDLSQTLNAQLALIQTRRG